MNLIAQHATRYGVKLQPYMKLAILECPRHEEIQGQDCTCILEWRRTIPGNLYRDARAELLDNGMSIVYVFYCHIDDDEEGNMIFLEESPNSLY